MVSFFIVLTIFFEAVLLHGTSPSIEEGFKVGANRAVLDPPGMFNSLPLIIFGFMYQCNIPAIYNELKTKNLKTGKSVL
jgi:amino acid permease